MRARSTSRGDERGVPRNLRRRSQLRLTGRGWFTIVLVSVAMITAGAAGRREFVTVAAAGFVLLVCGLLYARIRRPSITVERRFDPPIAVAGEPVDVTLELRNRARSATTALEWNDVLPWREDLPGDVLAAIPIGSRSRRVRRARYRAHPVRRGHYAIGPFVAEYGDPFGMVRSVIAVGGTDPLVVVPDLVDLPAGGPPLAEGDGAAQFAHRRALGTEDDLTTREYRPGDAMRRVHWRASARHGELMVRQEEQRSHPDVRIAIDTRLSGYPDAEPDTGDTWLPTSTSESFEWAVRMLASLAVHLDADGFSVALEESSATQLAPLGSRWEGRRRSEHFLTSLAGVQLLDAEEHRPSVSAVARGPVFAVLGDPAPATLDWLLRRRDERDVGVAFLVAPSDAPVRRLREAGWTVVPVRPTGSPAAAWAAVAAELEFSGVDD